MPGRYRVRGRAGEQRIGPADVLLDADGTRSRRSIVERVHVYACFVEVTVRSTLVPQARNVILVAADKRPRIDLDALIERVLSGGPSQKAVIRAQVRAGHIALARVDLIDAAGLVDPAVADAAGTGRRRRVGPAEIVVEDRI